MSDVTPVIDYTDKDFASMRRALLDLAAYRVPEWTDRSMGDLGMLFVDMFAYVGDIVSYYQDRLASELYLDTAVDRRSVMNLLRLLDYELTPPASAAGTVQLWFKPPPVGAPTNTTIPHGFAVATKPAGGNAEITFTYLGEDREIDLATDVVVEETDGRLRYDGLPVREGVLRQRMEIGVSRGERGLRLLVDESPVQLDTVEVDVREGGSWRRWPRRRSLFVHEDDDGTTIPATSTSRGYMLDVDEHGHTWAVFGDGEYHRRPSAGSQIRASRLRGGGAHGNVGAGSITEIIDKASVPNLDAASNPAPMSGGSAAESIEHAREFAPLVFRSRDRAVTLRDHVVLARQVPGVAKVVARTVAWNRVDLHIAPAGPALTAMSPELRSDLIGWFEDRRMIGTAVRFHDADPVEIEVAVEILVEPHAEPAATRQLVERTIAGLYSFEHVGFAQTLYISKIYEAVEAIDSVRATRVVRFGRVDELSVDPIDIAIRFGRVRRRGQKATTVERLPTNGQIEIGATEIPVLSALSVSVGFDR